MPRLQTIDPATATGPVKEIFDGPLKGKELNIFKGMGNSAATLNAYLALSGALAGGTFNAKEREVIQLAVGQANECAYCVAAHTQIGLGAGLTEAQTVGARKGSVEGDDRLNALATFARAVRDKAGWVSDEDVDTFRNAGFDDGQVAEVIANYSLAVFTNTFNHVNGTEVDFPAPPAL